MNSVELLTGSPSVDRKSGAATRTEERHTRVIVVGPSPPPFNGMSVATQLILASLKGNFEIYHLDTADRRGLANVGKLDFTNVYLAFAHGWSYLRALFAFRPQLVYVPISQSALPFFRDCLFLIPAKLLGKKVVVHLHGSDFRTFYGAQPKWFQWLVRFALRDCSTAIVLGGGLSHMFDGILPASNVRVVSNGIPDFVSADGVANNPSDPVTVLFLSTLMREKGVLDLVAAIPLVLSQVQNCRFVFAGEWLRKKEQEEAEELIAQQKLENFVEFMGPVGRARKQELLRSASVFVLPSYHEGQPFAILEALCAGLPIVATDVGCVADSVIEGQNGFLVEPGSPQTIANKILLLLKDPALRKRMGVASRDIYLAQHRVESFISGLSAVWASAVAPNSL